MRPLSKFNYRESWIHRGTGVVIGAVGAVAWVGVLIALVVIAAIAVKTKGY